MKTILLSNFSELELGDYSDNYVYHLISSDSVIYVGQTAKLRGRISSHMSNKDFDCVRYYPCVSEDVNNFEASDIVKYKPRLNAVLPRNNKFDISGDVIGHLSDHIEELLLDTRCEFQSKTTKQRRYFRESVKYDLSKIINKAFNEYFMDEE